MPAGAFYGQEATMPVSDLARKVRFGIKKRTCPLAFPPEGAFGNKKVLL